MGGTTTRYVATMLVNSVHDSESQQWATCVCDAHADAVGPQPSFTVVDRAITNLMAPPGNIISTVGDPSPVA